jgi:RNA polymerase sigma-70 factor (ECF subfamily)
MQQPPGTDDIRLMARVRKGDTLAFEVLHRRYQRKMLNFFFGLTHNTHSASDLCQETFLRIWKIRLRYRATGSFPGYLFGVARLVYLEHVKREVRRQHAPFFEDEEANLPCPDGNPEKLASRAELSELIRRAVEELPEPQRMVFVMRTVDGLSLDDIATALDCPVNTVRSRKLLAMKKLRDLLGDAFVSHFERTTKEYRSDAL